MNYFLSASKGFNICHINVAQDFKNDLFEQF